MKTRQQELATVLSILTGSVGTTLQLIEKPPLFYARLTPLEIFLDIFDSAFESRLDSLTENEADLLGRTRLTILESADHS